MRGVHQELWRPPVSMAVALSPSQTCGTIASLGLAGAVWAYWSSGGKLWNNRASERAEDRNTIATITRVLRRDLPLSVLLMSDTVKAS